MTVTGDGSSHEVTSEQRSVVTLLRDQNGSVLLTASSNGGPWSLIGGPVQESETLAEAGVRYPLEDCGLVIELGSVLCELSGPRCQIGYECGRETHWRATVYSGTLKTTTASPPMISQWLSPSQLINLNLDGFAQVAVADLKLGEL